MQPRQVFPPPPIFHFHPLLTIGEKRLRQLSEEGLEQAADHVEVLPALGRGNDIRPQAGPRPGAQASTPPGSEPARPRPGAHTSMPVQP